MENEITELRNQVRTLKRIVYGFGCLLVAGIVVGATSLQTVPDLIQAKHFRVVNDEGKTAVLISADEDGGAVSIFNKNGKIIISMYAKAGGSTIGLTNKDEKTAVICKELNITTTNYWVLIHRAKLKLRDCIQKSWVNA